VIANIILIA